MRIYLSAYQRPGASVYAYDRQGRLVRQEDAGGNVTCLYYDSVERLTDKRFLGNAAACPAAPPAEGTAQSISYLYSSAGSSRGQVVESARFGEGGVTWYDQTLAYNSAGLLQSESVRLTGTLAAVSTSYGYDAWHRPSTVSYFGGELLTTTYNGMGLPARLASSTQGTLVSGSAASGAGGDGVEYDAQGRLVKMHLGEGNLWRTQRYGAYVGEELPDNRSGLLTNIEVGTQGDSDAYLDLAYSYDSFGNLKTLTEGTAVSAFSYDDQNRLTSAFGRSFAFTPAGSFTSFEGKAATYTATPLHGLNTLNGLDVYEYDPSGRVVERTVGGVSRTLSWTPAGELRSVSVGGVTQESYRYDPNGERITHAVADGPIRYRFFPHYELSVEGGVETATRSYFFGGVRIAQRVGTGALTYLHGDHLGSTVLTTGVSGSKKYHAYGSSRSGSVPTEWQYTGQELDSGTGLVYLHARYYDPATGQFISPDTLVPEPGNVLAYNRYMYGYGNPVKYVDPSGHDPLDAAWYEEFRNVHGREPEAEDIVLRLFSVAFPDKWDFSTFYNRDGSLIPGSIEDVLGDPKNSGLTWDHIPAALVSLSGWYASNENLLFVRDIGTLFAGLATRSENPDVWTSVRDTRNPLRKWVYVGPGSMPAALTGGDSDSNIHHWAWSVVLGSTDYGAWFGNEINMVRELTQFRGDYRNYAADVQMGNAGVNFGRSISGTGGLEDLEWKFRTSYQLRAMGY